LSRFAPGINVNGGRKFDLPNATGSVTFFQAFTDSHAHYFVTSGRAPANWFFGEANGPCAGKVTNNSADIYPGQEDVECILDGILPFSVSPDTINGASPPGTMTVSGSGIDTTYGMPQVVIYDEAGSLMYASAADTIASDGSWATFSQVPALYNGNYLVIVQNVQSDGSLANLGDGVLGVFGNPLPPPDGGGCQTGGQIGMDC